MRITSCLIALALLVGSCGGGGGGGPSLFLSAPNVPGMSGFLIGPPGGATVNPSTTTLVWVGDEPNNTAELAFYRFNHAAIPAGSEILEAMFRVGQRAILGGPFSNLGGQVIVDHVELGAALDPADYAPIVYASNVAVLSTSSTAGQKSANVTAAVRAAVQAGRTRTDLMLRFPLPTDSDFAFDDVEFNNLADGADTGLVPLLEIRYRLP